MLPTTIIPLFDSYLHRQGLQLEATVIGGAALALLGLVSRTTDDCDVLEPLLPQPIVAAAREFAAEHDLDEDWFNTKSHDFVGVPGCLPYGWRARLRPLFVGSALHLHTLGRQDLLCTKLVALVDRGTDYGDCLALRPTTEELRNAWPFIEQYEGNPESRAVHWIPTARRQLNRLCEELGIHGIF